LSGNFLQLKLLKAAHPNLKVFISLGGWSWSKNFSAAAKTDALRKQLAKSCVKMFIAGDLPVQDGRGGAGAADVPWSHPASPAGPAGRTWPPSRLVAMTPPPLHRPGRRGANKEKRQDQEPRRCRAAQEPRSGGG
jgi:hypothetical protein